MHDPNLIFAWSWFLVGVLSGTLQGLFFHKEQWLGGYNSWPRRMTRLGHIAFFGTGLLNLSFALTILTLEIRNPLTNAASPLFIAGAVSMSAVCYASAARKPLRHLFFIPVLSLLFATALTVAALLAQESNASRPQ